MALDLDIRQKIITTTIIMIISMVIAIIFIIITMIITILWEATDVWFEMVEKGRKGLWCRFIWGQIGFCPNLSRSCCKMSKKIVKKTEGAAVDTSLTRGMGALQRSEVIKSNLKAKWLNFSDTKKKQSLLLIASQRSQVWSSSRSSDISDTNPKKLVPENLSLGSREGGR